MAGSRRIGGGRNREWEWGGGDFGGRCLSRASDEVGMGGEEGSGEVESDEEETRWESESES
jgi:hypothetical protein